MSDTHEAAVSGVGGTIGTTKCGTKEVFAVEGIFDPPLVGAPIVCIQGSRADLRALRDLIGRAMEVGEAKSEKPIPGFGNVVVRVTE